MPPAKTPTDSSFMGLHQLFLKAQLIGNIFNKDQRFFARLFLYKYAAVINDRRFFERNKSRSSLR